MTKKAVAPNDQDDDTRKEYFEVWKIMTDQRHQAYQTFDKVLLTLSGGALGFSLTFVQLVDIKSVKQTIFLLIAWISFGVSLFLALLSHLFSIYAHGRAIYLYEQTYLSILTKSQRNIPDIINHLLLYIALLSFAMGLIAFGTFAYMNLPKLP